MFSIMDTVQARLRYFRDTIQGLSLRDFRSHINAELPARARVSLGTLSNYEREAGGSPGAGPRAEFLAALKRAFPPLRLEWLILGDGEPTTVAQRLAAPEGLETKAGGGGDGASFAAQVLARYPDLELLSPEASAVFMSALTRLAMGEPKLALEERDLIELAGDLRWLLLMPLGAWGFDHAPPYRAFSDYAVGMLHAVSQLMPESGDGDPIADHAASILPRLRSFLSVGF